MCVCEVDSCRDKGKKVGYIEILSGLWGFDDETII